MIRVLQEQYEESDPIDSRRTVFNEAALFIHGVTAQIRLKSYGVADTRKRLTLYEGRNRRSFERFAGDFYVDKVFALGGERRLAELILVEDGALPTERAWEVTDREAVVDGYRCIHLTQEVTVEDRHITSEFWFCPAKNCHLVKSKLTRTTRTAPEPRVLGEEHRTDFVELARGVWFPRLIYSRNNRNNGDRLKSIRIGDFPDDVFYLDIPVGADVWDNVRGEGYFTPFLGITLADMINHAAEAQ